MPKVKTDKDKIERLLERGVENIFPSKKFLEGLLYSGKRLTIYQGIDPTGKLHIGHSVPLRKMKEFQDLGHKVIILFGDFTAMIGDPTDKSATRVRLTKEQVKENMKNYKKEISKIIRFDGENPAEIMFNSKWLAKMNFGDVVELASFFTVQQIIVRDMFDKRIKENKPVHLHEFLYPIMQGYDSVAMNVDGEVGGNDQTFNMLAGRDLVKSMQSREKFVLTTKLLEDPSGKKMGKTEGNSISLSDSADEMFGKVMAQTDGMIFPYFDLVTNLEQEEIELFREAIKKGENPRNIKFKLAEEVVKAFYDEGAALKAGERFNKVFKEKEKPQDIEEKSVDQKMINIVELIFALGLCSSKGEGRRLVEQGGVRVDDSKIIDVGAVISIYGGMIVQVGKRKFVKIKA